MTAIGNTAEHLRFSEILFQQPRWANLLNLPNPPKGTTIVIGHFEVMTYVRSSNCSICKVCIRGLYRFHILHNLEHNWFKYLYFGKLGKLGKIGRAAKKESIASCFLLSLSTLQHWWIIWNFKLKDISAFPLGILL